MRANQPLRPWFRPGGDPAGGGRPRARLIAASAAFHLLAIVGMMLIPKADPLADASKATRVVFYAPKLRDTAPPPMPAVPEPAPRPQVEPPRPRPEPPPLPRAEPPKPRPAPTVVRERPAPSEPRPEPVRRETRPAGFVTPVMAEAVPPAPRRAARTGSFGATTEAAAQTSDVTPSVARVGGFATETDAPAAEGARSDAPRVVARGSFGNDNGTVSSVAPTARPASVTVASTGFGSGPTGPATAGPTRRTGTVTQGGFGDADAPAPEPRSASRRVRPAENPDTPVEIVAKPRPVYTEDARQRRVEGEVVLQVTFAAAGTVHVLGVVQGLGFGLDEAAVDAALEIEFKPARRDGRPVDHTATLRVVFRLA